MRGSDSASEPLPLLEPLLEPLPEPLLEQLLAAKKRRVASTGLWDVMN
jgi:hypothetical protein